MEHHPFTTTAGFRVKGSPLANSPVFRRFKVLEALATDNQETASKVIAAMIANEAWLPLWRRWMCRLEHCRSGLTGEAEKAQANIAKHGVTFALPATWLLDPPALPVFDEAHGETEEP